MENHSEMYFYTTNFTGTKILYFIKLGYTIIIKYVVFY